MPTLLGNQLFPSDNPWNQRITDAPVAANSQAVINNIVSRYGNGRLHPDFSENYRDSRDLYGIPYNVVHGNATPKARVVIDAYPGESDIVDVPLLPSMVIEGDYQNGPRVGLNNRGDSHLLLYDVDNNVAYEFYRMSRPSENADGKWHADQQSVWDMKTNTFRTIGWTSADAAGLSLLAGLVRPDEALPVSQGGQGVINHAIRFTLQNAVILDQFLYPASHTANPGNANAAVMPPMGARFRLKASVDIAALNPQSKIIAQAMKDYGMIVADNGSNFFFSGASSSVNASNQLTLTFDDDNIQDSTRGLKSLRYGDFELVDLTLAVTGLSVTTGSAGATVTVVGRNFSGAAGKLKVLFGSAAAASITVVDDGHVTAVVPAGSGTVDVRVQSGVTTAADPDNVRGTIFGYGLSAISTNGRFTYGGSNNQPPAITSGNNVTFTEAVAGAFTVRATGVPTPALSLSGSLPGGVTFADNGDGTGRLAGTPALGTAGTYSLTITANNGVGQPATQAFTLAVSAPPPSGSPAITAVGTNAGAPGAVAVYSPSGARTEWRPYGDTFTGGVRVAVGDVNGDGVRDIVVAPGPGTTPTIKVYSGVGYSLIASWNAFAASFRGGAFVAAGDVLGLGAAQVVVGAGSGASPVVKLYDLRSGVVLRRTVQAFASNQTYGVTVGADVGLLVAGHAANLGSVRLFDGANMGRLRAIRPFGDGFRGGVTVAAAGGFVAVGRGTGAADVRVYRVADLALEKVLQTRATGPAVGFAGGTRVAWTRTAAGAVELVTGTGLGWAGLVQFWTVGSWERRGERSEYGGWLGGVWVA